MAISSDRPNPLGNVASHVGTAWAAASGLVGALLAFGVLTVAQANAITAAGDALPTTITAVGTVLAGILPLVSGVISAFRTASAARDHVTPVTDPRAVDGTPLVPQYVAPTIPGDTAGYYTD